VDASAVLILAAGTGTRMRSAKAKVLHEVCGLPMVLWPVRAALAAEAGTVVVVDSPQRALEAVLPEGVELAVQTRADGTGGAALAGLEHLDSAGPGAARRDPVLVLSGDVPLIDAETIAALADTHRRSGALATMATMVLQDPRGYGRVVRDSRGAVQRVVETKRSEDATAAELEIDEVNAGMYVFDAEALRAALPRLSADNAQGELYLPQVLDIVLADGGALATHSLPDPRVALGVNDMVALAAVRRLAQEQIHERHLLAGVDIVAPHSTVIDVDVEIGQDTVIEPFSSIRGSTRIGSDCAIKHSYLVDCQIEDGASVGPFAYVRPGTVLRAGSKVGTFVEVKNSDVGEAAKIPHLSYVGDAEVGEGTNLGAGTITANYDGFQKHRTRIGKRVRAGVDTAFVAPVAVGDDSWTAAGSVVTDDVPAGALAVARAKQRNVEGYSERSKIDRQGPLHSEEA
jgi:bifunctional UDP-N-acetylglucosamine pyrophosphorylase / glucosamine-1-phosphate N-acetyltransferase